MPNYTYTTGLPNGSLSPAVNRPSMQINNDSINSILGFDTNVDLFGFNNNFGGWHRKSSYTYSGSGSDPGSAASQYVIYPKLVGSSSELFVQKDNVATPFQLTSGIAGNVNDSGSSTSTWQSFLPGGLQIKGGKIGGNASGTLIYANANLIKFPNKTLQVLFTPFLQSSTNIQVTALAPDGSSFSWSQSTSTGAFYWMAIGY